MLCPHLISQLKKGRLRGRIDVGLSVMAMKKKSLCIDLDTEESIYHLKVFTTHAQTHKLHNMLTYVQHLCLYTLYFLIHISTC